MSRSGFDDAFRRGKVSAEAVEALLAYAETQSRSWFGTRSAESLDKAITLSRQLVARDAAEHTALLARVLYTTARQLLRRGRADEALPRAEEAAALARCLGGPALVVALACLSETLAKLGRRTEAAVLLSEVDKITSG